MSYAPNPISSGIDTFLRAIAFPQAAGAIIEAGDLVAWDVNHDVTLLTDTPGLRAAGIAADLSSDLSQSLIPGDYLTQSGLIRVNQGLIACMVKVPDGVKPPPMSRLYALDRLTLALDPADTVAKVLTPYVLYCESTENDNFPSLPNKIYTVGYVPSLATTVIPA